MGRSATAPRRAICPPRGRLFFSHHVVDHRWGPLRSDSPPALRAEKDLELTMKNAITMALALLLASGSAAAATHAGEPKHSPAHNAAVKRCTEAYEATA